MTVLVPERVVIGGGVAEAGDALLSLVREATARHCVLVPPDWYEVVLAELGPHAGAIGAALWARTRRQTPAPLDLGKFRVRRRHESSPEGGMTRIFPRCGGSGGDTDLPQMGGQAGCVWTTSMT